MSIEDDGPGLSVDQATSVMQRGQRADERAPGYGFGLPIASELAELYGGAITLAAAKAGGLQMRLSLPSAN